MPSQSLGRHEKTRGPVLVSLSRRRAKHGRLKRSRRCLTRWIMRLETLACSFVRKFPQGIKIRNPTRRNEFWARTIRWSENLFSQGLIEIRRAQILFDNSNCSATVRVPLKRRRAEARLDCNHPCKNIAANVIARPPSWWIAPKLSLIHI